MVVLDRKKEVRQEEKGVEEEVESEKILGDEHWRRWEESHKLPFVS